MILRIQRTWYFKSKKHDTLNPKNMILQIKKTWYFESKRHDTSNPKNMILWIQNTWYFKSNKHNTLNPKKHDTLNPKNKMLRISAKPHTRPQHFCNATQSRPIILIGSLGTLPLNTPPLIPECPVFVQRLFVQRLFVQGIFVQSISFNPIRLGVLWIKKLFTIEMLNQKVKKKWIKKLFAYCESKSCLLYSEPKSCLREFTSSLCERYDLPKIFAEVVISTRKVFFWFIVHLKNKYVKHCFCRFKYVVFRTSYQGSRDQKYCVK